MSATPKKPLTLHPPPALLIIDMQNSFCHPSGVFRQAGVQIPLPVLSTTISKINVLRQAFHAHSLPVIFVGYAFESDYSNAGIMFDDIPIGKELMEEGFCVRGSWDAGVVGELEVNGGKGEVVVGKTRNSAFANGSGLEGALRERGVGSLVCCGTATNVCVESTVRDGVGRDWRCVTVGDACATLTQEDHEASLRNLEWFGGVYDVEEVVEALERL